MQKNYEIMDNSIKTYIFMLLVGLFTGCNNTPQVIDELKNESNLRLPVNVSYKILYEENLISIIRKVEERKTWIDTSNLYKNENGYFTKVEYEADDPCKNDITEILIFGKKDSLYSFECVGNKYDILISDYGNGLFSCIQDAYGISNFRKILYYDKNFKIIKIVIVHNNVKSVYSSTVYKHEFKLDKKLKNKFLEKKRKDSLEFMRKNSYY